MPNRCAGTGRGGLLRKVWRIPQVPKALTRSWSRAAALQMTMKAACVLLAVALALGGAHAAGVDCELPIPGGGDLAFGHWSLRLVLCSGRLLHRITGAAKGLQQQQQACRPHATGVSWQPPPRRSTHAPPHAGRARKLAQTSTCAGMTGADLHACCASPEGAMDYACIPCQAPCTDLGTCCIVNPWDGACPVVAIPPEGCIYFAGPDFTLCCYLQVRGGRRSRKRAFYAACLLARLDWSPPACIPRRPTTASRTLLALTRPPLDPWWPCSRRLRP